MYEPAFPLPPSVPQVDTESKAKLDEENRALQAQLKEERENIAKETQAMMVPVHAAKDANGVIDAVAAEQQKIHRDTQQAMASPAGSIEKTWRELEKPGTWSQTLAYVGRGDMGGWGGEGQVSHAWHFLSHSMFFRCSPPHPAP